MVKNLECSKTTRYLGACFGSGYLWWQVSLYWGYVCKNRSRQWLDWRTCWRIMQCSGAGAFSFVSWDFCVLLPLSFFCFLFTVFVLLTVNIIIIYIYSHNEFKLSLIFYFILFFGYTHEFILFFLLLGFWWFIYIRLFIFCTTLTHL